MRCFSGILGDVVEIIIISKNHIALWFKCAGICGNGMSPASSAVVGMDGMMLVRVALMSVKMLFGLMNKRSSANRMIVMSLMSV